MADYTKMQRQIWRDKHFCALPAGAQRLYWLILTQPTISSCGVQSLSIRRWATLAADTDADSVRADLAILAATDYVWIDEDTEEVAARTYMKHDELWKQTQGRRSIELSLASVLSDTLRCRLEALASTLGESVETRVDGTVEPPQQQQQAASTTAAAAAPGTMSARLDGCGDGSAAAAALEMYIKHKIRTEDVRNPKRYTDRLRRDLPIEHGQAIAAYLENRPDADCNEIAVKVLGLRTVDLVHLGGAA